MHYTRVAVMAGLFVWAGLSQADVRVEGLVEYGIFSSQYQDFQPG